MKSVIIGIIVLIVVLGGLYVATMNTSTTNNAPRATQGPVDNSYSNFKMN